MKRINVNGWKGGRYGLSVLMLPFLMIWGSGVQSQTLSDEVGTTPAPAALKLSLLGRARPSLEHLPDTPYGRSVRYGHALTAKTYAYLGPEVKNRKMRYAGNNLACTSCHQEDATKPFAIPLVGITATFPQYQGRIDGISTLEERINGCMERSMNGRVLPPDSQEMKAFLSYIHFLSRGIPVGAEIEGLAVKAGEPPDRRADLVAGKGVYQGQCQVCHGEQGEGKRVGVPGDALGYLFPPIWGPDTFNTGASMNNILKMMNFVKHNMPQGTNYAQPLLSDEEAFDVAGYIVSMPRPVMRNLERDFPARWNKPVDAAFPPYGDGASADQHKYGPFPPLIDMARQAAARRVERSPAQQP